MTTVSFSDADALDLDILFRQWVLGPLPAQTYAAQTIKLVMRCSETNTNNNLFLTWIIRALAADDLAVIGSVVGFRRDATEAATSLTSRADSPTSAEVITSESHYLVIEIGMGGDPSLGGNHSSSISIGDNGAADLTEGDADTDADNPWIEFANTITVFPNPKCPLIVRQAVQRTAVR